MSFSPSSFASFSQSFSTSLRRLPLFLVVAAMPVLSAVSSSTAFAASANDTLNSAKKNAVAALQRAQTSVENTGGSCRSTNLANIQDAVKKTKAINQNSLIPDLDNLQLSVAGIAIGAALTGCSNIVSNEITAFNQQIDIAKTVLAGIDVQPEPRNPTPPNNGRQQNGRQQNGRQPNAPAFDDSAGDSAAPAIPNGIALDTFNVDPEYVTPQGEPALLFTGDGITAGNLRGKKLSMQLLIKRKSSSWNKAFSANIDGIIPQADAVELDPATFSIRYSTLQKQGYSQGRHVAALVVVDMKKKKEIFRDEVEFDYNPDFYLAGIGVGAGVGGNGVAVRVDGNGGVYAGGNGSTVVVQPYPGYQPYPQNPPVVVVPSGPQPLDDRAFSGMYTSLSKVSGDLSRIDMLKNMVKKSYFSSDQLGQVLALFSGDLNRLDAAKIMIPKVIDPENAYAHSTLFSGSLSQEDYIELLSH